ncbi:hypothetical protein D9758_016334 [Tetrapyrgos nigripes]|uniref:Uncharacterized protein n=1 Tax=Tetrapyrgos nigripes TaxID=182062 RepID=A0A8H5FFM2_9AGAR|nr:hypothetical protein D9758_016334 [Tetrapyrgos nigripes]
MSWRHQIHPAHVEELAGTSLVYDDHVRAWNTNTPIGTWRARDLLLGYLGFHQASVEVQRSPFVILRVALEDIKGAPTSSRFFRWLQLGGRCLSSVVLWRHLQVLGCSGLDWELLLLLGPSGVDVWFLFAALLVLEGLSFSWGEGVLVFFARDLFGATFAGIGVVLLVARFGPEVLEAEGRIAAPPVRGVMVVKDFSPLPPLYEHSLTMPRSAKQWCEHCQKHISQQRANEHRAFLFNPYTTARLPSGSTAASEAPGNYENTEYWNEPFNDEEAFLPEDNHLPNPAHLQNIRAWVEDGDEDEDLMDMDGWTTRELDDKDESDSEDEEEDFDWDGFRNLSPEDRLGAAFEQEASAATLAEYDLAICRAFTYKLTTHTTDRAFAKNPLCIPPTSFPASITKT